MCVCEREMILTRARTDPDTSPQETRHRLAAAASAAGISGGKGAAKHTRSRHVPRCGGKGAAGCSASLALRSATTCGNTSPPLAGWRLWRADVVAMCRKVRKNLEVSGKMCTFVAESS